MFNLQPNCFYFGSNRATISAWPSSSIVAIAESAGQGIPKSFVQGNSTKGAGASNVATARCSALGSSMATASARAQEHGTGLKQRASSRYGSPIHHRQLHASRSLRLPNEPCSKTLYLPSMLALRAKNSSTPPSRNTERLRARCSLTRRTAALSKLTSSHR